MNPKARSSVVAVSVLLAAGVVVQSGGVLGAQSGITPTLQWSQTLNDAGSPVALSSPDVAGLAGGPAVVVGDRAGDVYAFDLSTGAPVGGWPFSTGGVPVDSTPSVDPDDDSVLVGVGNSSTPNQGGYQSISSTGANKWYVQVQNPSTDQAPAYAVESSMAIGDLQGQTDAVSGTLGEAEDALNAANGAVLPGFPWFQADSDFSTPALADLYSNGTTEIIEGGDSSAGIAYGTQYSDGGHIRVLAPTGNGGTGNPAGGLDCEYNSDQVIQSSPAVGAFLPGNAEGIAVGTGTFWPGATTTDQLLALNTHCQIQWADVMDGATTSSPALADFLGNGQLQVAEGTDNGSGGSVYVVQGGGQIVWHAPAIGRLIGSVVSADLTGSGRQDVIAATTGGVEIFDGATGDVLGTFAQGIGFQNSPIVTADANGTIGITVAGYNANDAGVVEHFEIPGSNGSLADEAGAWPMFHHDPQLTGNAATALPGPPPPPPSPNPGLPVQRIYGSDAIGTSIAVSQAEFPTAGSAKAVVLARSDFFSDALAGGPLAARVGGPLLITPGADLSSALDPRVQAEIERVLPTGGTVYILGGDLALSSGIDSSLQGLGYSTQRIAGSDEYATAVDIAEQLGNPSTIFEATGTAFQDALSAVPAAIAEGGAVLLTDGSTQAPETAAYLATHTGDTRYAIGGTFAAYGADPTATPVYGQDLFGTSAAVATTFFPDATVFGGATGADYPDALSGDVFMGSRSHLGPVLLVNSSVPLPASVANYLDGDKSMSNGYLFGGSLAVGNDVMAAL